MKKLHKKLPFKKVRLPENPAILLPLHAVVTVLVVESICRHSLIAGILFLFQHPYSFLVNALIVGCSYSLALLFRKQKSLLVLFTLFWLTLGIINGVILIFRVTPFTSSDLLLLKDGVNVASKYLSLMALAALVILLVLVILVFAVLAFRIPAVKKRIKLSWSVTAILCTFLAAWGLILAGQKTDLLETKFRELSQSYKKNGFLYCFGASLIDVGISRPEEYSTEAIEGLTDDSAYDGEQYDSNRPNIVVVQLESFFDVNRLKDVEFSENPLPNFTRLSEKCASGFLSMPVIGAGTVNSEFEMLTGMNIDDFGIGEYPYKTVLKEKTCESLAYDLKPYGYKSFAIHNHEGSFYERNLVYPNLGFDVFDSVEYMWPEAYTAMDWAKDSVLTGEIEKALNSTAEKDFIFTVAVQSHGSYPSDPETEYEHHLTAASSVIEDEDYLNQINYYANQIYEVDQFVGDLWNMLRKRREPTILVMYGDHCPSLDLSDDKLKSGTIYDTCYFIWDNTGLSFEGGDLQAYEVGSGILSALGIPDGVVNAYHQNGRKQLKNGELEEEEYLEKLKELEYDILYGDRICYGGDTPYYPSNMTMGLSPVKLNAVNVTHDHVMKVSGENFTRYSVVHMGDEKLETLYLDPETLVVPEAAPEDGTQILVSQAELSTTGPYRYVAASEETEEKK